MKPVSRETMKKKTEEMNTEKMFSYEVFFSSPEILATLSISIVNT